METGCDKHSCLTASQAGGGHTLQLLFVKQTVADCSSATETISIISTTSPTTSTATGNYLENSALM
jgi:muramidase (phage lysozyme)